MKMYSLYIKGSPYTYYFLNKIDRDKTIKRLGFFDWVFEEKEEEIYTSFEEWEKRRTKEKW